MTVSLHATERQLVPAGVWIVDGAHSSIEFRVRHLMLATVKGRFTDFEGTLEAGPGGEAAIRGTVRTASVDTHEPTRDEHLRSPDFFDAAAYPELTFASTGVEPLDDGRFRVRGELTLHGATRPIELEATALGVGRDPWGGERLGIEASGEIDRTEFGLAWNTPLESGGFLLSDAVRLEFEISAVRQAEPVAA
jgi:polyisoprenoid-binding protein YceI